MYCCSLYNTQLSECRIQYFRWLKKFLIKAHPYIYVNLITPIIQKLTTDLCYQKNGFNTVHFWKICLGTCFCKFPVYILFTVVSKLLKIFRITLLNSYLDCTSYLPYFIFMLFLLCQSDLIEYYVQSHFKNKWIRNVCNC